LPEDPTRSHESVVSFGRRGEERHEHEAWIMEQPLQREELSVPPHDETGAGSRLMDAQKPTLPPANTARPRPGKPTTVS
jgi:hypothetical protein